MTPERASEIELLLAQARAPQLLDEVRDMFRLMLGSIRAPFPPEAIEAQATLFVETDRGSVLVGAAFLDDLLRKLLLAAMLDGSDTGEGLLRPGGALGDFMVRARVAYSLGLIGKIEFVELETVAQIRNQCAHVVDASSFEWKKVSDLMDKLRCPILMPIQPTPRRQWIASVSILGGRLLRRISETKHAARPDESDLEAAIRARAK